MLHFVQGRSGTGKTTYVQKILSQLAESGDCKLLYLIPEQSSFESETAFLRLLGPKLCRNINVMSFTRLYDMVTRQTGGFSGIPIDDGVRRIMMSLALEDCVDRLELYKRQALKPQLTELMLSAVKEFKMCGISSSDLRKKAAGTRGTDLSKKLTETALVTDVYNAYISKSYIDPLDNNARLEKRLADINFFADYTVVVDGFSGFTAQEQRILDLIMEQCSDFYITLCMDSAKEDELFFTVNRTRKRILRSAQRLTLKVASPVILDENYRTGFEDLLAVEKGIYRIGAKTFKGSAKNVTVGIAQDIFEECEYIAEQIKKLTLNGECRYRDIAVVCRNSEKYRGILDAVFDSHGIAYFMSKPQPIDNKPLFRLVLSALEYVLTPSDSEKFFSVAKSGLTELSDYEIAELENYVYIWGINGRCFSQNFTLSPLGYSDSMSTGDINKLALINKSREKLITPLIKFTENIKNPTAEVISKAIYQLLLDFKVPEILKSNSDVSGYELYSNEEVRLWDIIMDVLNKMVLSIGDRAVSVKRYYELFKMMVCSFDISEIPQTLDQVLVGTADSIRLSSPKTVFVIGAVDGEFPHNPVSSGIFSDAERRSLILLDLPVYDSVNELYLQEKYLVYSAVSAARERLYITYYNSGLDGSPVQKSSIVTEVQKILPDVKTDIIFTMDAVDRIRSEKTAFEIYASLYRQNGALSDALSQYFNNKPEFKNRIEAIKRMANRSDFSLTDRNISVALFGKEKKLSASQVEKFYMCRFQYFCNYGLKLRERRKAGLDAIEYGSLVHYLLENVLKIYKDNGYTRLSESDLEQIIEELLKQYVKEYLGGEGDKSDRFMHLYYRLRKSIQSLLNHLTDELEQSEFKPVDFELTVGDTENGIGAYILQDSSGNNIIVSGKIDRVDMMEKEKARYIRIIDYKTGSKEFKISDVLYGLNMQMLIYLSAVNKNGSKRYGDNLHPSGILYVPSTVVSVNVSPGADEREIQNEHDKKLRMNGLVLNEPHIIRGMEENMAGKYIPVSYDKKGAIKQSSKNSVISADQLNMIFDKVDRKILEMSEMLDCGDIAAVPVSGAYDACKWCIYSPVCGHKDSDKNICVVRNDKEDVIKELERENEGVKRYVKGEMD